MNKIHSLPEQRPQGVREQTGHSSVQQKSLLRQAEEWEAPEEPGQALWYKPAIPILARLRQENFRESEASWRYIESSRLAWAA